MTDITCEDLQLRLEFLDIFEGTTPSLVYAHPLVFLPNVLILAKIDACQIPRRIQLAEDTQITFLGSGPVR